MPSRTMVTCIADALERGVQLVHHCRIDHIETQGSGDARRAIGAIGQVEPTRPGSRPNSSSLVRCASPPSWSSSAPGLWSRRACCSDRSCPTRMGALDAAWCCIPACRSSASTTRRSATIAACRAPSIPTTTLTRMVCILETLFVHPAHGALMLPGLGASTLSYCASCSSSAASVC